MRRPAAALAALPILLATYQAWAHFHEDSPPVAPIFSLDTGHNAVGAAIAAGPTAPYLAGSRIAALPGPAGGAVVIDADSGQLILADAAGSPLAAVPIGPDAGVLAYDPFAGVAYVADRHGDRVVTVRVTPTGLLALAAWRTPAEPYGVALSPDRATLLVTTVADRTLLAYDVATGAERWRAPLAAEPRGVAISPDGSRALVTHLGVGLVEDVELRGDHDATPRALASGNVRGTFAAQFLGAREAVVPFQREVPINVDPLRNGDGGHYGGTEFAPPITDHLELLGMSGARTKSTTAQISDQQPRALAWDDRQDLLYVAGMGTDSLLQIGRASQVDPIASATAVLTVGGERCGPDGIAIASRGDVLVWCAFSRRVERFAITGALAARSAGPALVASSLDAAQHRGMVEFHTAEARVSMAGGVACASCHLEGRADGMSWSIEGHRLQTPMLAGRLAGTAPFKWDGGAKDLAHSIDATITRLGGSGLPAETTRDLVAYLEHLPAVRTPTRPREEIARGKQLFESADLGCASCHDGAVYTDQSLHRLAGSLTLVDTPSLIGLAASAPYFHDGSAPTIESLLRDRGGVHGMADAARQLDDGQVRDLAAFLETL